MEMEHKNYASQGLAGTALGLGAGSLGVGALNTIMELAKGWQRNQCNSPMQGAGELAAILAPMMSALATMTAGSHSDCSDNNCVNRYELGLEREITNKDMEIAYLRGRDAAKSDMLESYKFTESEFRKVWERLAEQAVHNQKTEDSFHMVHHDLEAVRRELLCKIEQEAKERCCSDNAIVNYSNATFYPKMVADVTTGTTTTAQLLYNPIPDCGCGCGRGN